MTGEWQPDPTGQHQYRWWDGQQWTDQVANNGEVSSSPLPSTPAPAEAPPASQTEPATHAAPAAQAQSSSPDQPQTSAAQTMPASTSAGGTITGDLVDGSYAEREAEAIANQNTKLLRVRVGEPFMARQGSMVAYQGAVQFDYQGGGAAKFLKKAMTGEGLSLMKVSGQGDVFLANLAYDVHILNLNNSGISISGKNVLAFSAGLDWNVERVKGGSIAAGGLFNTTVRGTGWVAITTDGPPVVLNAAEAPTFVDTDAVVAWSADLQTSLQKSFSAGALIGRGSGEAFQVTFNGAGFVIVQPSEGFTMATA